MKKMINIIGGRKMFLALILFFIACVCLFTGIAQFGEWGEFCKFHQNQKVLLVPIL